MFTVNYIIIVFFFLISSFKFKYVYSSGVTYCHPTFKSCFYHQENNAHTVNEYHHYIVGLIKEIMNKGYIANFVLGYRGHHGFTNSIKKIIQINYSVEHTLVRPGGRTIAPSEHNGTVPVTYMNETADEHYIVREVDYEKHLRGDIIFEYRYYNE